MAWKRLNRIKLLAIISGITLAWIILPAGLKSFVKASFYEFQAPAWKISSHVNDLQGFWGLRAHSKDELIEAGRDLARWNSTLHLAQQHNKALQDEITSLEELLDLPSLPEYRYEVARIAKRDLSAWWQQLIIRKGNDYNIPVGAAVIYSGGVVGRIKEVHSSTSIVELISSRTFRMAANFEGDKRPVTYQGISNPLLGPATGNVRDVPPDITVSKATPGKLISSRLGGIFPQGLVIGHIDHMEPGNNGLFMEGKVKLNLDLLELREVAIIIPVSPDL